MFSTMWADSPIHEVRRAILDFNRKRWSSSMVKHAKLDAQMAEHNVKGLLDACCLFVYVQGQIGETFGMVVLGHIRSLWLKGLRD